MYFKKNGGTWDNTNIGFTHKPNKSIFKCVITDINLAFSLETE